MLRRGLVVVRWRADRTAIGGPRSLRPTPLQGREIVGHGSSGEYAPAMTSIKLDLARHILKGVGPWGKVHPLFADF
jgi:hypothetical protein